MEKWNKSKGLPQKHLRNIRRELPNHELNYMGLNMVKSRTVGQDRDEMRGYKMPRDLNKQGLLVCY